MAFETQPFGVNESQLFARLPLEDRYMGYGAVGHIRAELNWFDFYSMWCPESKELDTPAFRSEMNALLRELRDTDGIFHSCPALGEVFWRAQSFDDGGRGFKIQTADYSYYVRCAITGSCSNDIIIFAYDNTLLMPQLAGQHELPKKCFSVQPESGELVMLQQDSPYIQRFDSNDPPEVRRQVADELNEAMGVTKAQEAAMCMGVEHGFDQPCAWPWQYDKNGEPRETPHRVTKKEREYEGK